LQSFLRFPCGPLWSALFASVFVSFRSRAALQLEILALRHQLGVLQRSVKRPKLTAADRCLWVWFYEIWDDWRSALFLVQPSTVIGWHRKGFRLFWTGKIRSGKPGRPAVSQEIRDLIRRMSRENPLWGAPRSPWQRAYVERVIGTLRRECLDHVIVFNQASLSRHLRSFLDYYYGSRCHLALAKDTPEPRPVQPPDLGRIVSIPQVGGLHHRYERRAA
jgi:transposase InsO family protein